MRPPPLSVYKRWGVYMYKYLVEVDETPTVILAELTVLRYEGIQLWAGVFIRPLCHNHPLEALQTNMLL